MMIPDGPGQRWSLDFVSDQLASSRRFRVLNIIDDYSRECIGQIVDTDLSPELDPFLVREKLSYHAACCANTAGGT